MVDYSVENNYIPFQPPFNLFSELEHLEADMKRFFPYLSHRNCRELNKAIKSIKSIQNNIKIEENL